MNNTIPKIQSLTDNNLHAEAIQAGLEFIEFFYEANPYFAKEELDGEYEVAQGIVMGESYGSLNNNDERRECYLNMMAYAGRILPPELFIHFKNSF